MLYRSRYPYSRMNLDDDDIILIKNINNIEVLFKNSESLKLIASNIIDHSLESIGVEFVSED